jgi:hypothetical protein
MALLAATVMVAMYGGSDYVPLHISNTVVLEVTISNNIAVVVLVILIMAVVTVVVVEV